MLALANIYGIGALLFAINVGHDGAHAALSRHRWINPALCIPASC
jgi:fatty acid desaturase